MKRVKKFKATKCFMCHSAQYSMIATVVVGTSGDKLVRLLIQIINNNTPWGTSHNKLNTHYVISKSKITQLMTLSKLHHSDVVCVTSPEV